jgi:NaMN:DMB phosphoribosyltransferase
VVLDYLILKPLLALDMRLGEGTGAALGISLVEAARKILNQMATFAEAGVADKRTPTKNSSLVHCVWPFTAGDGSAHLVHS